MGKGFLRFWAVPAVLLAVALLAAPAATLAAQAPLNRFPNSSYDVRPPTTKLTYPPRQDFLGAKKVRVYLRSNEAATAIASGQLEIGRGDPKKTGRIIYGLYGVKRKVKAGTKKALVLRMPRNTRKAAAAAIANGKKVVVKVTVTATDAVGNRSGATVAVIRPKP